MATDINECKICFTIKTDKIFLDCGHWLCRSCESKWEEKTCPFCRTKYSNIENDNYGSQSDTYSNTNDTYSNTNDTYSNTNDNYSDTDDNYSNANDNYSLIRMIIMNLDGCMETILPAFQRYIDEENTYDILSDRRTYPSFNGHVIKVNGNTLVYFDIDTTNNYNYIAWQHQNIYDLAHPT